MTGTGMPGREVPGIGWPALGMTGIGCPGFRHIPPLSPHQGGFRPPPLRGPTPSIAKVGYSDGNYFEMPESGCNIAFNDQVGPSARIYSFSDFWDILSNLSNFEKNTGKKITAPSRAPAEDHKGHQALGMDCKGSLASGPHANRMDRLKPESMEDLKALLARSRP